MKTGRRAALAGCAALSLLGTAALAAPDARLRAPNLRPDVDSAEAGLWGEFDKAEAAVKHSADLNRDPALQQYVKQVVCKIATEYCGELRVYVLDRPIFNATAAANGYMEVWSGLMLRARSEDELAYVLGHEVSHFARNHSLARWNAQKTTANVVLGVQALVTLGAAAAMYNTASTGAPNASQAIDSISQAAQSLNNLVYLIGVSNYFRYNREQEVEADQLGFLRSVDAGYAKGSGALIWSELLEETRASDFPSVRKSDTRATIFDSHPLTAERVQALAALGDPSLKPDLDAQRRYRAVIRPHLAAWLKDDLRRRDFGQTLHLLQELSELGEDLGVLQFYVGEAYRQRRGPADAILAVKAYETSVQFSDAPAVAWRELGEARRKAGDKTGAAAALENYLTKVPDADDRWLVEASLETLKGSPSL